MDYQTILRSHLLSKTNIDLLVGIILKNFKISQKAIPKCINIIIGYLNRYLDNLERYPENNNELVEAIKFLNKKCYDDFTVYLFTKYPNTNLVRADSQTETTDQPKESVFRKTNENSMTILTEEEKNQLLKQHGILPKIPENKQDEFLSYLTNPMVLQMFSMMTNQCNKPTKTIKIDQILDAAQVATLLNGGNTIVPAADVPRKEPGEVKELKESKELKELKELKESKEPNKSSEFVVQPDGIVTIDLSKGLTREVLPLVDQRIKELVDLKNKYLVEKKMDLVNQIDEEKNTIISLVKDFKTKLIKEATDAEKQIKGMTMSITHHPEDGDNVQHLRLEFDPSNDFNDLKNILIKSKSDNKITDITLVDYYLPFNNNNVTRFNNKFVVYFNNRVNKIIIPPGKYEIEALLDYIKNQATFLEFSLNDDKIITIKNTMNMKFDLMVDHDTVFPLLGFTDKTDIYKDKLFYSGSVAYNISSNEKVFFSLSGSSMDPMVMEFDKEITINKSLRKSRNGVTIKQMILSFTNAVGQCYDFIMPFRMYLRILYAS